MLVLDAYIFLLFFLTQKPLIPHGSCSKSLPTLLSEEVMPHLFRGSPTPPAGSCSQPLPPGHQAITCSQHIPTQTHYFLPELALPPLPHLFYSLTTKNYLFPISFNTTPIHAVYQVGTLSAAIVNFGYIEKYLAWVGYNSKDSDLIGLRCGLGMAGGDA